MKKLHCFMVPMHNEAKVIQKTLRSLRQAGVSYDDVYLVDDGCTDTTLQKLKSVGIADDHILSLSPNVGKTKALISLFETLDLKDKYCWVNTLDADTILKSNYMSILKPILLKIPTATVAVCSRVEPTRSSWNLFIAYRSLDYCVSHRIYKKAQGYAKIITVLPGCGATFRTEIFERLITTTDSSIITEDMDWTIELYHSKLGEIFYADKLIVITQDPDTLGNYTKQIHRWFRGSWQVFCKRKMWNIFKSKINIELLSLIGEGLVFSGAFLVAFSLWFLGMYHNYVKIFFELDFFTFIGVCIWAMIMERDIRLPILSLPFYVIRITNCFIFLISFLEIVVFRLNKHYKLQWNKVSRY